MSKEQRREKFYGLQDSFIELTKLWTKMNCQSLDAMDCAKCIFSVPIRDNRLTGLNLTLCNLLSLIHIECFEETIPVVGKTVYEELELDNKGVCKQ